MKKTILLCDYCGKENPPGVQALSISLGRSMDPSGNGYVNDVKHVDVCPDCLARMTTKLVNKRNLGEEFLSYQSTVALF